MNTLSIHLLSFLIALYLFNGNVHAQDDTQSPMAQLAVVEVFHDLSKILITHPDERTEVIEISATGKGNERAFAHAKALRSVLQRFYDQGWEIESELFISVAVASRSTYVLKRERR